MRACVDILVVEDDAHDSELTSRALKSLSDINSVRIVEDGQAALDFLHGDSSPPIPPKLILLDLNLPKIHGLEVLRRLREDERTQAIPVVILTSSKQASDLDTAYSLGVNSYLCKPIDLDGFLGIVQKTGIYWASYNETPLPKG